MGRGKIVRTQRAKFLLQDCRGRLAGLQGKAIKAAATRGSAAVPLLLAAGSAVRAARARQDQEAADGAEATDAAEDDQASGLADPEVEYRVAYDDGGYGDETVLSQEIRCHQELLFHLKRGFLREIEHHLELEYLRKIGYLLAIKYHQEIGYRTEFLYRLKWVFLLEIRYHLKLGHLLECGFHMRFGYRQ
ncbi:unnamed protein product, partial [Prorocentrum cordatum]